MKKDIVNKVFVKKENLEKLYKLEQELEFSFMQKLFYHADYEKYQGIKNFLECKSFISNNIDSKKDSSFRGKLEEQLRKLDKPKREELERVLLSSIDNEFQALANQLTSHQSELKKKTEEKLSLPKLFHPSYWDSYMKKEETSLKICEETLRKSVATGDDELFYKIIKDIKKSSKYMWVFQVNETLFDDIYKTQHDSRNKMLSFRELAEKFIGNRKKYVADQLNECQIRKATSAQHLVNMELTEKDMDNQKELNDMAKKNEMSEKKAEEERRAKEKAEERAEKERRTKEEERRAKEEAEAKVEMERAEKKAINLLYDEAEDQEISRKKIKQNKDVLKFLECQYTFLVLSEDCTTKFKNLCQEYKDLGREVKEPDFERLSKLANEFDKLSRSFTERKTEEEESRENIPECNDQSIDRLKLSIVTRVVQARKIAEKEKKTVEKEKFEVEEIIKQLQPPDSAFSSMNHESVAGPSWKK